MPSQQVRLSQQALTLSFSSAYSSACIAPSRLFIDGLMELSRPRYRTGPRSRIQELREWHSNCTCICRPIVPKSKSSFRTAIADSPTIDVGFLIIMVCGVSGPNTAIVKKPAQADE
jgi:hypothetical protein